MVRGDREERGRAWARGKGSHGESVARGGSWAGWISSPLCLILRWSHSLTFGVIYLFSVPLSDTDDKINNCFSVCLHSTDVLEVFCLDTRREAGEKLTPVRNEELSLPVLYLSDSVKTKKQFPQWCHWTSVHLEGMSAKRNVLYDDYKPKKVESVRGNKHPPLDFLKAESQTS